MPTPDGATLVADRQAPAATQPPPLEDSAAVLGFHAVEETMFTTTWDTLWLPGSLGHRFLYLAPARQVQRHRHNYIHDNGRETSATPVANNLDEAAQPHSGGTAHHYT